MSVWDQAAAEFATQAAHAEPAVAVGATQTAAGVEDLPPYPAGTPTDPSGTDGRNGAAGGDDSHLAVWPAEQDPHPTDDDLGLLAPPVDPFLSQLPAPPEPDSGREKVPHGGVDLDRLPTPDELRAQWGLT